MNTYTGIHLPAGCSVEVGSSIATLQDVGVIPMDTESMLEVTYEISKVQGSKREQVVRRVRNMIATANTELYQFNLDIINKLAGGVMTIENVAGDAVPAYVETIAADWDLNRLIILGHQNYDGSPQTIATVKSGATVLAVGIDYVVAADAAGNWGIVMIDNANAPQGTALEVTYAYTPAASVHAKMGSSGVTITPKVIRFKKTVEGKLFQVTLWSATMTNGIRFTFAGADAENPARLPITIEGQLDTSRADGDQLLDIIDELGVA